MTRFARIPCGLLLGAVLWGLCLPGAFAQQTHTLTIQNGTVYVDGRQLTADQVPSGLDLEGMTTQYQFVGVQRPIVELNGRLYAVEDGLTRVSEEEVNAQKNSVVLQEMNARSASGRPEAPSDAQAATKQYLSEVQKANRDLYQRLVRERKMERQAQNLARVIRLLPEDSEERAAKADTLRALLNDIFDLKQENRRREIERLQRKIQELQNGLQQRKKMRDAMIEKRLQYLMEASTE